MRKRILIAAVLAILLLPIGALGILFNTQAGLNLVVGQLWRLERLGVHIEGVSGTLAGPLKVERFELNHPRAHIVVHQIVVDPDVWALLLQTIRTSSLTAREAEVVLRKADQPPTDRPPRFLPPWLRIDAKGLDLERARYVHENGTAVVASRIQGRVTVSSKQVRARHFNVQADWFDAKGDLRLTAGRPFGLEANVSGHLRLREGEELALNTQVDGTFDRLTMRAQLLQPATAAADLLLTRPDERWNIAGTVSSPAFTLQPFMADPPFSLRNVALDVTANPDQISLSGNVGVPEFDPRDLTIDVQGRYADRVLHLASADVELNGTPATLHASGRIAFDGEAPTLDMAARWQSLQWPLRDEPVVTSTTGDAVLRGPLPYDFSVTAQVSAKNLPPFQGSAQGVLSKEQVRLDSFAVNALEGTLSGSAYLEFARPRAWKFSARAIDVNPEQIHHEFPGRLSVVASGEGRGVDKEATFAVTVGGLKGRLRGLPVSGGGSVRRDAQGWVVNGASVRYGDAQLALDGSLRKTIDARWSLSAESLEQLLPDAAGSIDFTGTASGPRDKPHVVANLRAEGLRYQEWVAERLTINGDVDVSNANPSRLFVLARRAGRGEPLLDTLRVTGDGVASDHRIGLEITGFPADAQTGAPHAEMSIAGRYDQEVWTATVTTTKLTTGDPQDNISVTEPALVSASKQRASMQNLCVVIGAGRVCANGKWQREGAWEATVAGYEIPLAALLPPSGPEAEYAGRIEGRVHASGRPGEPWLGEAGMRIIDAAIIYRPPGAPAETLNLGTGGLAATATAAQVNFSFGVQAFTDTFLYANARLQRNGRNDFLNLPLTGDVRARAADANVLPLLFADIDHAAGLLTANVNVTGTLARPEIAGRVELTRGELDSYRANFALRDVGIIADLTANTFDFRGTGRAGDGQLRLGGKFAWDRGVLSGNLNLNGDNLLVADLPEYRVVASPDVRMRIEGRQIDVSGDVRIPSARIQPAKLSGAVRASDDAQYVGQHPAEREGRFVVHSEVRIAMGEDVRLDAFGLQGRILGSVGTTVHTGEDPIGRGQLSVDEGRYEAYGQKLEINKGNLLFTASPLDDPGLDIEARRKIEQITVGLNVRGTLQEPRLTFFSDPSMPQTQIITYLLTGKEMGSMTSTDKMTMEKARDSLALQGTGILAAQLGHRIGIEEVGVESSTDSAGATNTALVLGKFLSPRLYISYGISLTESINTLKLRYTISDRWVFRTEAGEYQSADLEYTIERK
jgi:translocation and assembly module TamB